MGLEDMAMMKMKAGTGTHGYRSPRHQTHCKPSVLHSHIQGNDEVERRDSWIVLATS